MKKICFMLALLVVGIMLSIVPAEASILLDGSSLLNQNKFDALVYWRVYSPLDATSPLGSISDYGYYYQVKNVGTGTDKSVTQFGVDNPFRAEITNAGYLINDINDNPVNLDGLTGSIAPNMITFGGENSAVWTFQSPSLQLGKTSYLLYFTSPVHPMMVDGGALAGSDPASGRVPGPAPEPATMVMLGIGLAGFVGNSIRKKFTA